MATAPYFFPHSSAATYHHPFPIGFPTAYTPASAVYPPPPPAPTPTPSTAPSAFGAPASGSPPIPPPPGYPYAANHTAPFPYPAPPPVFFQAPARDPNQPTPAAYRVPPAFPSVAAYPYPPPASAYPAATGPTPTGHFPDPALASGVSPAPAFPYAASFPAPADAITYPYHAAPNPSTPSEPIFPTPTSPPARTPATALPSRPDRIPSAPLLAESSIPTQIDPNRPPAAPAPVHGDPYLTPHISPLLHQPIHLAYPQNHQPPAPESTLWTAPFTFSSHTHACVHPTAPTKASKMQPDLVSAPTPAIDSRAQQNGDLSSTRAASNNHCSRGSSSPSSAYGEDEQVPAKVAIHHRLQHELRSIQARIDQQQARERTALNALQGELAKLKSAASMLAVAMGMQTAESPVTGSSPGSMVTAASATSMLCAAPSSSASDSTVPAAHANVAPQVLEEMPQSYGLHNLTQRTVFRADGSEHRYYALTDSYPSERAVPEPVFSVYDDKSDGCAAESVHVFTNTPEQLTDEEDQHENSQALKLSSKPIFSPERPTAGTGYVFSLTNEQTPKAEHVKQQQVNNQQWNRLMTEIGRKEWDPGTLKTILDVPAVVKWWSSFDGLIDAVTSSSNILSMIVCAAPSFPNMLVNLPLSILWDPGEHTILSSRQNMVSVQDFTNHVQLVLSTSSRETTEHCLTYQELKANYLREVATLTWHRSITGSPSILLSSTTYKWDPGVQLTLDSWLDVLTVWSAMVKSFSGTHGPDLVTWQSQMTSAYLWDTGSMLRQYKFIWLPNGREFRDGQLAYMPQGTSIRSSEWIRHMVIIFSCWPPSFEMAKLQCYPGIALSSYRYSWLGSGRAEHKTLKALVWSPLPFFRDLQYHLPMSNTTSIWNPGILNQMNMILTKSALQNLLHSGQTKFMRSFLVGQPIDLKQFWARMLLQYHSWYSIQSDFLQVPYFLPFLLDCPYSERVRQLVCYSCIYCMSTATTVRMILVLSSGKIVQEERDAAAVYHIFRIQLPMNKTSHIWDHGIRSLMIKYIWLHVHMIQLVACTSIDINIPKWTSTTSNVIRSSEYGYTMDCPNGQWEFLHEEGVHESYSAKNLLPLQSYLQTWEMDIIFITFLPP